ncbi:MAG: DMT family transporter [Methanobacteriota archaeon]
MGDITNLVAFTLAIGASFFWALAQLIGKMAMRELNSTLLNTIRISFIAAALTPVVMITGLEFGGDFPIILALVSGVFGIYASSQVFFYTIKRSQAHVATTVSNSSPVWTVIFALFLLSEGMTATLPFSLAFVIGGSLLFVPRNLGPSNWKRAVPFATIVASLWGFDQMLRKWCINLGMGSLTFLWLALVFASLLFSLNALAKKSWRGHSFSRRNVGLALACGLSGQLLGTFLHISSIGLEKVSAIAPVTTAAIPFGFLMSIFMFQEKPNARSWIGMALVFAGVFLAAF